MMFYHINDIFYIDLLTDVAPAITYGEWYFIA